MDIAKIGMMVLTIIGWSLGGILALLVARYAYQVIAPFDVNKELTEDRNTAVGASKGMFLVASGIILHGLIVGDKLADNIFLEIGLMVALYMMSFALLWLGRMALVLVTRSALDFNEQIHVKDNLAVGLIEGSYYIGFAIIIHSSL